MQKRKLNRNKALARLRKQKQTRRDAEMLMKIYGKTASVIIRDLIKQRAIVTWIKE